MCYMKAYNNTKTIYCNEFLYRVPVTTQVTADGLVASLSGH